VCTLHHHIHGGVDVIIRQHHSLSSTNLFSFLSPLLPLHTPVMATRRRQDDWFLNILEPLPQDATLTVQEYGCMLILEGDRQAPASEAHVTHVSENLESISGVSIDHVLHHSLAVLCEASVCLPLITDARKRKSPSNRIALTVKAVVSQVVICRRTRSLVFRSTSTQSSGRLSFKQACVRPCRWIGRIHASKCVVGSRFLRS
jgi:hypothetical protein